MSEEMMEEQPEVFQVFARPNEKGDVIKIFSTCFFQPQEGDVLLKEGSGDEFAHVSYYKIYDENGILNYKIENGALVERDKTADMERFNAFSLNTQYIPPVNYSIKALFKKVFQNARSLDDETKLEVSGLVDDWHIGVWSVGDLCNYAGQTYECYTAFDNAVYPDITPQNPQTWANFWRPLHGTSAETARPWVKPQFGTVDMYHKGEYMVWTDGTIKVALRDTVYSPDEYAMDWKNI